MIKALAFYWICVDMHGNPMIETISRTRKEAREIWVKNTNPKLLAETNLSFAWIELADHYNVRSAKVNIEFDEVK